MWRGAKTSFEASMTNVAYVRTQIELIEFVFGKQEVSEIWITFPDPFPQKPKSKKTTYLTSIPKSLQADSQKKYE